MVEKIWFEKHWIKWLFWPVLWPLSLLFGVISQKRRSAYQTGKKPSYRPPVPIVVVGNITAGGNGKTPVVIWLVEQLHKQGVRVGVVSRGYGAKAPSYPYTVNRDSDASECGDEPLLIHRRTGAPVVVDPNRSQAVQALQAEAVEVVITDDGLQHYALQRDVEIVVIDGKRRFGNEQLLPLGPLREGVARLAQVDFLITNGGEASGDELSMRLKPDLAVNLKTGEQKSVSELSNVVAFAGIGHPPRFFDTLQLLGARVNKTQGFADHQAFSKAQVDALLKYGDNVIMTEKDAVKCRSFCDDNWWYLPVSATLPEKAQQIIKKIIEVKEHYGSSSS